MRREKKDRRGMVILIMSILIIVLVGIIVYSTLIKPSIAGYIWDKQIEARDITIGQIVSSINQLGYVEISVGEEKIYLARIDKPQ